MQTEKSPIERRRHKRFSSKNGAFAVVHSSGTSMNRFKKMSMGQIASAVYKSNPSKVGRIVDLSRGGLSFCYIDDHNSGADNLKMDILSAHDDFYLGRLPFKIVRDESAGAAYSPLKLKQQRVAFRELTSDQKRRLDDFLKNHMTRQGAGRPSAKTSPHEDR